MQIEKLPYLNEQEQIARKLRTQYAEGICRHEYYTVTLKSRLRDIHDLLLVELFDVEYYHDLEMWVRGHSRSLKMIPFISFHTVCYSPSIVTMAVSLTISEIFSVKEWPNLEIWVWGPSRSLRMAPFDRPRMTLLVSHCNYSSILYHLRVIYRLIIR